MSNVGVGMSKYRCNLEESWRWKQMARQQCDGDDVGQRFVYVSEFSQT